MATKKTVSRDWFDRLTTVSMYESLAWVSPLPGPVTKIADFGCMSCSEPFALLWLFNADEIVVVDKDPAHFDCMPEERERVLNTCAGSLDGRTIKTVVGDMTEQLPELPADHFDLAFCERVLYYMSDYLSLLELALSEMVRVTRPGGFIVAHEPSFVTGEAANELLDLNPYFAKLNLSKLEIVGQPPHSYAYAK